MPLSALLLFKCYCPQLPPIPAALPNKVLSQSFYIANHNISCDFLSCLCICDELVIGPGPRGITLSSVRIALRKNVTRLEYALNTPWIRLHTRHTKSSVQIMKCKLPRCSFMISSVKFEPCVMFKGYLSTQQMSRLNVEIILSLSYFKCLVYLAHTDSFEFLSGKLSRVQNSSEQMLALLTSSICC